MTLLIQKTVEAVLQECIFVDLAKGRKDFDLPHTKAVVYWMKQLLKKSGITQPRSKILITAAYAHDWGYIGLFDGIDSSDLNVIHKMKPLHMERGAVLITTLLREKLSDYFSEEEIQRVADLVRMHDKIEELTTADEILLMEADTLGMLDAERVTPTFTAKDNAVFIERELHGRRLPHFQDTEAKRIALKLEQGRMRFYTT